MTNKKNQNDELDLDKKLGEELGRAEHFVQANSKVLSIVVGALIVIIGGYVGFKQFVIAPQEQEAQAALFIVQQQFANDSFSLVVNGNGNDLSAVEIVDEYGMTKAGNLAAFMAGISYLRLGQFEEAYDYLNKFSADDDVLGPFAIGLKGDALVEQGDVEGGVKLYISAANASQNELVTPYFLQKAGVAYTSLGKHEEAKRVFTRIKEEFKDAPEAIDIEKYIERAAVQVGE
ncbi:MAG: tetratricopeptide repeat protein [Bacteroidota bacterium]|nr:tetratricopeptide repeat protein [Bacteroidota bacterium]MDX5431593.1 tetratricopeptide repeat protein [Bacteroidota bacterium]MDX5470314.1 tetratricopeptide repeat protein [Bacteroidota bacterium]